jgi:hypothetical protein
MSQYPKGKTLASKRKTLASKGKYSRLNRSLSAASYLESKSYRLDRSLSRRASVASDLAHSACMLQFLA